MTLVADNLTPEQRKKTMTAVKGKDTSLEMTVDSALAKLDCRYERNVKDLPGKPDFVFRDARVAIFVDGDFWHGWRFPKWKKKLSSYWQQKIQRNRDRDRCNTRKLRYRGWKVIRVWGHQIQSDLETVVFRVQDALVESGRVKSSE